MSERIGAAAISGVLLLFFGAMTWMALGFGEQARRIPLVVGVPTTVLLGAQFVRDLVSRPRQGGVEEDGDGAVVAAPTGVAPPSPDGPSSDEVPGRRGEDVAEDPDAVMKATPLTAFLWIAVLGVTFYLLGMLYTIPVFMGVFMRVYGGERWLTIGVFVGATLAILYLFFVVLLDIRLYAGFIPELLGR